MTRFMVILILLKSMFSLQNLFSLLPVEKIILEDNEK